MIHCERWDPLHRRPVDVLDEEQARERYRSGPTFTAVVPGADPETPEAVLEIDPGATRVLVTFLGPGGATATTYLFRRRGQRLFLERIEAFSYEGDQLVEDLGVDLAVTTPWSPAGVVRHETLWFRPDGVARRTVDDATAPTITTEDRDGLDVEAFWEDVPAFGAWEAIAAYER